MAIQIFAPEFKQAKSSNSVATSTFVSLLVLVTAMKPGSRLQDPARCARSDPSCSYQTNLESELFDLLPVFWLGTTDLQNCRSLRYVGTVVVRSSIQLMPIHLASNSSPVKFCLATTQKLPSLPSLPFWQPEQKQPRSSRQLSHNWRGSFLM